ncbi:anaphase-promoting complex subunit Hcn1 [Geranomyces variabilis]|uniref:Anaphase-promoting complex subunit Hcn1 n=1 Tax=Geranomyces variabilis TaxID=109894 RepID=A0AAD5TMK8_9FUNG|nr:anaphase-promoting complex subunit Hcn1 [Geranomyces variabilis]
MQDCMVAVRALSDQVHIIQSQLDILLDQIEANVRGSAQQPPAGISSGPGSFNDYAVPEIKPRPIVPQVRRFSVAGQMHRSLTSLNAPPSRVNTETLPVLNDEAVEMCISRSSVNEDTNEEQEAGRNGRGREDSFGGLNRKQNIFSGSMSSLKNAMGKIKGDRGKVSDFANTLASKPVIGVTPMQLAAQVHEERERALENQNAPVEQPAPSLVAPISNGKFLSRRQSNNAARAGRLAPLDTPDVLPRYPISRTDDIELGPDPPRTVETPEHLIPIKHRPRHYGGKGKKRHNANASITASAFGGLNAAFAKWYLDYCTVPRYTEFMVPYTLGEMADVFDYDEGHLPLVSVLLTIVFSIDALLGWLMLPNGPLSRSWFVGAAFSIARDFITVVPFDLIFAGQYVECFLYLRLIRAQCLHPIVMHNPMLRQFSRFLQGALGVGDSFTALVMYVATLAAYFHVFSCSIFLLGRIYEFDGWEDTAYLIAKNPGAQYTFGMFTAAFQAEAFRPKQIGEQWNLILSAIISAGLHGAVLGTVSALINSLDPLGRMYKQKIEEVNEYMKYKGIGVDIRKKVREYFHLKYRGKYFNEGTILYELNDSLRQEIVIHNCRELITQVSFLCRNVGDGRDENFLGRIAMALKPVYYVTGDTIFEQGRVGNEMYFIIFGSVEVIIGSKQIGSLTSGAFFGEVALLGQTPRTATIKAVSNVMAYQLDGSDFDQILCDFPDVAVMIRRVYEERMTRNHS